MDVPTKHRLELAIGFVAALGSVVAILNYQQTKRFNEQKTELMKLEKQHKELEILIKQQKIANGNI